eukprot:s709_g24.t1
MRYWHRHPGHSSSHADGQSRADWMIAKQLLSQRAEGEAGEAEDQSRDVLFKSKVHLGECKICGETMEAMRLVKTLPCNHHFHSNCIDGFHRQKLLEKNLDLPCFTCGAASNKSIAAVIEERRRKKAEEEAVQLGARQAEPRPRQSRPKGSLAALAAAARDAG